MVKFLKYSYELIYSIGLIGLHSTLLIVDYYSVIGDLGVEECIIISLLNHLFRRKCVRVLVTKKKTFLYWKMQKKKIC